MEIALDRLKLIESFKDRIMASNQRELMRAHEAVDLLKSCQLSRICRYLGVGVGIGSESLSNRFITE